MKRTLVVATEESHRRVHERNSELIIWAATHLICQGQLGPGSIDVENEVVHGPQHVHPHAPVNGNVAGAGERVTSDPVERSIRIPKRDHEECEGNEHLAAQNLILDSFGPLTEFAAQLVVGDCPAVGTNRLAAG